MTGLPALSVVVVSAAGGWRPRRTLAALAAQTIADRIEVLLITPERAPDGRGIEPWEPGAGLSARFLALRRVIVPAIDTVDHMVGRHLLDGAAPIVGSVEDHAFPDPEWAERVLEQFAADPGCVAVTGACVNANPGSSPGWANFLVAFGQRSVMTTDGPIPALSLHNCCYRGTALKSLASGRPDQAIWPLFNRESEILEVLKERGGRLRFARGAALLHLNSSLWLSNARLRFHAGRLAAFGRVKQGRWGWGRRLIYVAGGPLIPLVRYRQMRPALFGPGRFSERRHGLPVLYGLVFDALGQMAAFLNGPGNARRRLAEHEFDRTRELNRVDSADFGAP